MCVPCISDTNHRCIGALLRKPRVWPPAPPSFAPPIPSFAPPRAWAPQPWTRGAPFEPRILRTLK
jgi:hypothetical protein